MTEEGEAVEDATENHPDGSSAAETSNWTLVAGAGGAVPGRRKVDAAELASSCADSAYSTRSSDDVDDPTLLLSEDEPNDQVLC